jgi:hypothetical protein
VKGHLSQRWSDLFDELDVENRPEGEAVFSGVLPDQAALYGVLNRLRDLGVMLVSLSCSTEHALSKGATPADTSD